MAVDGRLNFDTKIDTKGFSTGTKQISSGLGNVKSMLGKVAVAAAAAFSVKKMIDFGKEAINTASDLQEVQNVVDTAFGSMSDKMEQFAKTSITQFGISRLAAKQTGSTFMAMASGMGIAQDGASDMAIALAGLSADMASFYNVEQDVASTALKSIFTGETETLKKFGVVMTEANLEAFALSQGINKSLSAMTQAEKVQLRYNYVMAQTSLAHGDFAKTQDSWANQTRILSEQWKEFSGTVGQALMGVLLPAVKVLNKALSSLISYAQMAVKALSDVFGIDIGTSDATAGIVDSTAEIAENYEDMAESAEQAQKANEKQLAGFDKVTKLSDDKFDSKSGGNGASKVDMGLYGKQGKISTEVEVKTDKANKKITAFFKKIKQVFDKLKKFFSDLFEPFKKAWDKKGKSVINSIKKTFDSIWNLIKEIGKSFSEVWNNGTGQEIVEHLLGIFQGIFDIIGNIADRFSAAWSDGTGTAIVQGLLDLFDTVLGTVDNIIGSIKEWAEDIDFSPFLQSVDGLLTALAPFAENVGGGLEWFVENVLLPLADWVIEDVIPSFLDLLASAIGALDTVINGAKPMLSWLWEKVLKPFAEWTGGIIVDVIKNLTEKLKNFSDWAKENQGAMDAITATVLGFFAGIVFYYSAKKIITLVGKIKDALSLLGDMAFGMGGKIAIAAGAFGLMVTGILLVAKNWGKLSPLQKVASILTGLAVAAGIAAVAIAVFHTAWSVGVAAVAIAGGIAALGLTTAIFADLNDGNVAQHGGSGDYFGDMDSNVDKYSEDEINSYNMSAEDFYNSYDFSNGFKLPKFATGTVVPANYGEFLAILGDNKRETEVVSPLSTIEQAVTNAINRNGGVGNGSMTAQIQIDIDGRKLHTEMVRLNNARIRQTGNNPLVPVN